jgi:hypothetical protein
MAVSPLFVFAEGILQQALQPALDVYQAADK